MNLDKAILKAIHSLVVLQQPLHLHPVPQRHLVMVGFDDKDDPGVAFPPQQLLAGEDTVFFAGSLVVLFDFLLLQQLIF